MRPVVEKLAFIMSWVAALVPKAARRTGACTLRCKNSSRLLFNR